MSSELNDAQRCTLVSLYKLERVLWDKHHTDFKSNRARIRAIQTIVIAAQIPNLTQRIATHFFRNMRRDFYNKLSQGLLTPTYLANTKWEWIRIACTFLNVDNMPQKPQSGNTIKMTEDIENDRNLELVEYYKDEELLWNPQLPLYKVRALRESAWHRIVEKLQITGMTADDVRIKIKNLRTTYHKKRRCSGADRMANPETRWLHLMDSFLGPVLFGEDGVLANTAATTNLDFEDDERNCRIIECYQQYSVLWNPIHPEHNNRVVMDMAWDACVELMDSNEITRKDFQRLLRSLVARYTRKRRKIHSDDVAAYCPNLKWFHVADSFLGPIIFHNENVLYSQEETITDKQDSEDEFQQEVGYTEEIVYEAEDVSQTMEAEENENCDILFCYLQEEILWNPNHPNYTGHDNDETWTNCLTQPAFQHFTAADFRSKVEQMLATYQEQRNTLPSDAFEELCSEWRWLQLIDTHLKVIFSPHEIVLTSENEAEKTDNEVEDPYISETVEISEEKEDEEEIYVTTENTEEVRLRLMTLYKNSPILWNPAHATTADDEKLAWQKISQESRIRLMSATRCKQELKYLQNLYLELRRSFTAASIEMNAQLPNWFIMAESFLGPLLTENDVARQHVQLICRACLTNEQPEMKSLKSTELGTIYSEFVGIRSKEEELKLATELCSDCETKLLDFREFRNACLSNENAYLEQLQSSALEDDTESEIKDQTVSENEETVELNIEPIADYEFEELNFEDETANGSLVIEEYLVEPLQSFVVHQELVTKDVKPLFEDKSVVTKKAQFPCNFCSKVYGKREFLVSHLKLIHGQTRLKKSLIPNEFPCSLCRSVFRKQLFLSTHMKYVHGQMSRQQQFKHPSKYSLTKKKPSRTICHICGKELSPASIKIHLDSHKSIGAERFQCHLCEKNYKMADALRSHINIKHQGKTYDCGFCSQKFTSWNGCVIHTHLKHYNTKAELQCEFCERQFPSEMTLRRHIRIIHGNTKKSYKCDECGTMCSNQMSLKAHKQCKHSDEQWPCDQCNKVFSSIRFLRSHQILHTGEKNYKCPVCGKLFAQNVLLRTHVEKMHPTHKLPPKGTILNIKALERIEMQQQLEKSFVKIDFEG